ncbi:MAG: LPS export ABC transporter periplasmic protein LptC [Thiothrix sp.]|uniref:LPS export ABC transporter periplasmic protein LptC n=1 Tax=Thiothrix sp. TaxID=1032 RepID=UPI0026037F44|nr:LPS export ABC transporter periplasmic protein LptC [Thiothrix sp.]MDD5393689.1 LPS export ABC transporter periplasmic protein LptC [Thiothrix sp.]
MKRLIILVIALLSILLITRMEDYLGQQDISKLAMDKDRVDYYLSGFSITAITPEGTVNHELTGHHLSHWQKAKQSLIIAPVIFDGINPAERTQISADEGRVNQTTQVAELTGNVHSEKPGKDGQNGFKLRTDYLTYNMTNREVSTKAAVSMTTPSGTMQSTGLTGKLDEDLLRLNTHVHSTYQVK